jgi:hypothetical protein
MECLLEVFTDKDMSMLQNSRTLDFFSRRMTIRDEMDIYNDRVLPSTGAR